MLVLLLQEICEHARHALLWAHRLNLLVLDVAAQRKGGAKLVEAKRQLVRILVARALSKNEGATQSSQERFECTSGGVIPLTAGVGFTMTSLVTPRSTNAWQKADMPITGFFPSNMTVVSALHASSSGSLSSDIRDG